MRRGITNDGRRAGTSVALTSFAALGEEEEAAVVRTTNGESELARIREQAEKMRGMSWADIDDDNEDTQAAPAQPEEEETEEEVEFVIVKGPATKTKKTNQQTKQPKNNQSFDALLATMSKDKTTSDQLTPTVSVADEKAREKARAELRAKLAASRLKPTESKQEGDEKKKKTKSEKKEAKKQFQR